VTYLNMNASDILQLSLRLLPLLACILWLRRHDGRIGARPSPRAPVASLKPWVVVLTSALIGTAVSGAIWIWSPIGVELGVFLSFFIGLVARELLALPSDGGSRPVVMRIVLLGVVIVAVRGVQRVAVDPLPALIGGGLAAVVGLVSGPWPAQVLKKSHS